MYIFKSSENVGFICENCIEMLGMPSSGKSTKLKQLLENDENIIDVNDECRNRGRSKYLNKLICFFSCLMSPISFFNDIRIIVSSRQNSLRDLLLVLFNWFSIIDSYNKRRKAPNDICIWDQGLFQALWSIDFRANTAFDMEKLLHNKKLPLKIYFFDEEDVALKEWSKRKSNARMRLNYDEDSDVIRGRESMQRVIKCMKNIGYYQVEQNIRSDYKRLNRAISGG